MSGVMEGIAETKIFLSDIRGLINAERYNRYAAYMPQHVVAKVNAMKPLASKRRTLGAWALLLEALKTYEDTAFLKEKPEAFAGFRIGTNDYGKPYMGNYSWLHFNLSHSGDAVMCVVAPVDVGCDIQKIRKVNSKLSTRFFTSEENALIGDERDFARIWSRKESVMKMTGRGFQEDIASFDVTGTEVLLRDGTNCYVADIPVSGEYHCAVCSRLNDFPERVWRIVLK